MGRLTERTSYGYMPNENANYEPMNCTDKLGRLEDLEEQGRLIELPDCEAKELLINIVANEVNVCPVDMGFEQEGNCNDGCYACWKKYL